MRRRALQIDAGIALLVAIVVLIISPGVAVDAIVALFVLVICAISFALESRRTGSRRTRAPRRPSRGG